MSDIPDDIKATAAEIGEIVFDASVDLYETGVSGTDVNLVIARALLAEREAATKAERERIAHFVETEMTLDPEGSDFIATAIRSGARP